jgi:hypothetical protein
MTRTVAAVKSTTVLLLIQLGGLGSSRDVPLPRYLFCQLETGFSDPDSIARPMEKPLPRSSPVA